MATISVVALAGQTLDDSHFMDDLDYDPRGFKINAKARSGHIESKKCLNTSTPARKEYVNFKWTSFTSTVDIKVK